MVNMGSKRTHLPKRPPRKPWHLVELRSLSSKSSLLRPARARVGGMGDGSEEWWRCPAPSEDPRHSARLATTQFIVCWCNAAYANAARLREEVGVL